jgi:hypothetical protein
MKPRKITTPRKNKFEDDLKTQRAIHEIEREKTLKIYDTAPCLGCSRCDIDNVNAISCKELNEWINTTGRKNYA